ncbi:hypothetical protein CDEST_12258 [Colletotrichum destructivum]|uniref:Uncharacterized protein n=1 Tax=Colletotrichum destructivum TaxID=34406 RepID=A0AAX4IVJ8_9PEZI|nr:hypothetical protein CDEST_12258 [Colletotrichum destructivum]
MLLHGAQSPSHALDSHALEPDQQHQQHQPARQLRRKRKAESQDNERLSKRLSLLNLEKNGQKLYVPVEEPTPSSVSPNAAVPTSSSTASTSPTSHRRRRHCNPPPPLSPDEEVMQLDDTKHKVYIYSIDDELSSSESETDDGKLVFLPDIEKHLRATRIPPSILANDQGELAGMQVVLYNEPTSLTIPREQDSVRKAIVESRARMRERQRLEREGKGTPAVQMPPPFVPQQPVGAPILESQQPVSASVPGFLTPAEASAFVDYDPDAMDVD